MSDDFDQDQANNSTRNLHQRLCGLSRVLSQEPVCVALLEILLSGFLSQKRPYVGGILQCGSEDLADRTNDNSGDRLAGW